MSQLTCNLCGGPHPFDTVIDNETWNRVIRRGGKEHDQEFLCLSCIVRAFAEAGVPFRASLSGTGVTGTSVSFSPAEEVCGTCGEEREEMLSPEGLVGFWCKPCGLVTWTERVHPLVSIAGTYEGDAWEGLQERIDRERLREAAEAAFLESVHQVPGVVAVTQHKGPLPIAQGVEVWIKAGDREAERAIYRLKADMMNEFPGTVAVCTIEEAEGDENPPVAV